jgi:DNA repair protein radC
VLSFIGVKDVLSNDGGIMLDLQNYQMPREKFIALGPEAMALEELLAILLRTGRKGASVLEVAHDVVERMDHVVGGLNNATVETLREIEGIGQDKAVTICAAIELGRRLGQMKVKQDWADFSTPEAAANYMMERLRHKREEHFYVLLLTVKNKLIKPVLISKGGLTSSTAEQRAVFRQAIDANAAAMILMHNHPSGDPTESSDDVRVTKIFARAGEVMGIPVLDHIIIGDGMYVSLLEKGIL